MMFGTIVVSGVQMIGKCGYTQRNITIAALSLSIGLGFTQCPDLFNIFPDIVRSVFAENCVALVLLRQYCLILFFLKVWEKRKHRKIIEDKLWKLKFMTICRRMQ